MAGVYTDPFGRGGVSAWVEPPLNPLIGRGTGMPLPAHRNLTQAVGRLGVASWGPGVPMLGQVSSDTQLGTGAYAAISLLAASFGGASIGYVSAGDSEGAATGAMFAGGFAALSDALLFGREGNTGGALMMAGLGMLGIGTAFFRFNQTRGGGTAAYSRSRRR